MALPRSRKTVLWDWPVGGSMVDPDTFGGTLWDLHSDLLLLLGAISPTGGMEEWPLAYGLGWDPVPG